MAECITDGIESEFPEYFDPPPEGTSSNWISSPRSASVASDAKSRGVVWRVGAFVLWVFAWMAIFSFCYRLILIVFDSVGIDVVVVGEGTRADPKNPPGQTAAVALGAAVAAFAVWVLHRWWHQESGGPQEF